MKSLPQQRSQSREKRQENRRDGINYRRLKCGEELGAETEVKTGGDEPEDARA